MLASLHMIESAEGKKKITVAYLDGGEVRWYDDEGELYYAYQKWCNLQGDYARITHLIENGPW